jgi:hypothetical protein
MEIRTHSDSNENEYNLILRNDQNMIKAVNGNLVFSPSEGSNINVFPSSVDTKSSNARSFHLKSNFKNQEVSSSQENLSKKFISRNDPYQNAHSNK